MEKNSKIYVAGHRGLVGSAIVRGLKAKGYTNVIGRTHKELDLMENAFKYNVKKLMFLGSSCIYPKMCPQPIKEEYLLSGYLEETNEGYALAKISGLKMCQFFNKQYGTNYISVMPT